MRTTIVFDDQLAAQAKQRAAAERVSLSEWVNRAVRSLLRETRPSTKATQAFHMVTFGGSSKEVHHRPEDFWQAQLDEESSDLGS